MDPREIVVVLSTFPDEENAARVGRALVEEGLAACAQIDAGSLRSFYRWKGELQDDREFQLRLKTAPERRDSLTRRLAELHPYEVPQIVSFDARASASYAKWLREQCVPETPGRG